MKLNESVQWKMAMFRQNYKVYYTTDFSFDSAQEEAFYRNKAQGRTIYVTSSSPEFQNSHYAIMSDKFKFNGHSCFSNLGLTSSSKFGSKTKVTGSENTLTSRFLDYCLHSDW